MKKKELTRSDEKSVKKGVLSHKINTYPLSNLGPFGPDRVSQMVPYDIDQAIDLFHLRKL